jgi:hypothetical protein
LIGLSLSFCIGDILEGKVKPDEIIAIISSTNFSSPEEAIKNYSTYWNGYDEGEVKNILNTMWPLVFQPRKANATYRGHSISNGHWVDTKTSSKKL